MKKIFSDDIRVVYENLPYTVKGLVRERIDCTYTVILNNRHCDNMQSLTLRHEVNHLKNGDYDMEVDVGALEHKRHED